MFIIAEIFAIISLRFALFRKIAEISDLISAFALLLKAEKDDLAEIAPFFSSSIPQTP
jgi:hypothetical protein